MSNSGLLHRFNSFCQHQSTRRPFWRPDPSWVNNLHHCTFFISIIIITMIKYTMYNKLRADMSDFHYIIKCSGEPSKVYKVFKLYSAGHVCDVGKYKYVARTSLGDFFYGSMFSSFKLVLSILKGFILLLLQPSTMPCLLPVLNGAHENGKFCSKFMP